MSENLEVKKTATPFAALRDRVVRIAADTLPGMLLTPEGPFCLELIKDSSVKKFEKGKSWRYTIMCLLGIARAQSAGCEVKMAVDPVYQKLLSAQGDLTPGDIGLVLWLAVRISPKDAPAIFDNLRRRLDTCDVNNLAGMEIAWILAGLAFYGQDRNQKDGALLVRMLDYFFGQRVGPSGLIYHLGHGIRKRFPNFATQIYSLHALSICARVCGDARCAPRAEGLANLLIKHQRANGGWPWLYDAENGAVVEPFEVYSVHQHGMAPMAFLEYSEATGFDTNPIMARSLAWLEGNNELGVQMIDVKTGLIYRSIRRRRPSNGVLPYVRAVESYCGLQPGGFLSENAGGLEVNATCRPYELGWLLEAWCGRNSVAAKAAESAAQVLGR